MFTIIGGVLVGYTIFHVESKTATTLCFEQMWDAILTRDKLNRREWNLHPSFIGD